MDLLAHFCPRFDSAASICLKFLISSLRWLRPLKLARLITRVLILWHTIKNCSTLFHGELTKCKPN